MSTIHLIGLGPGWSMAPECGPGVKTWGINNILNWRPVDYVFEIHNYYNKLGRLKGGGIHQMAIRKAITSGTPYIVREKWPFLPGLKQVVYPWESVFKEFQTDFLGCSMDCMIALAVYCGYTDIQLYGIGINRASNYDYQIPSMNFWMGFCMGRGINIKINLYGGYRHTDVMRTVDGTVYGLNIPQRPWSSVDPTLPECDCVRRPEAAHCNDFE